MAKNRQENPPTDTQSNKAKPANTHAGGELPWHPFWRWLVSSLVVLHLAAVFSAPWDLATGAALPPGYEARQPQRDLPPPQSVVWQTPVVTRGLHGYFHNYLNLLYLNHGYEFFAPDPAGAHIIDYQVTKSNGEVVEGRLPSHDGQWPRLLYHRHMMLAEQTQLLGPGSAPLYAEHLATLHVGRSRLQLKMHHLLPPHRVADETPLDAPSTYEFIGEIEGRPRPNAATSDGTASSEPPVTIPGAQP